MTHCTMNILAIGFSNVLGQFYEMTDPVPVPVTEWGKRLTLLGCFIAVIVGIVLVVLSGSDRKRLEKLRNKEILEQSARQDKAST